MFYLFFHRLDELDDVLSKDADAMLLQQLVHFSPIQHGLLRASLTLPVGALLVNDVGHQVLEVVRILGMQVTSLLLDVVALVLLQERLDLVAISSNGDLVGDDELGRVFGQSIVLEVDHLAQHRKTDLRRKNNDFLQKYSNS